MNTKSNLDRPKAQKLVVLKQKLRKTTLENWDLWERLHDPRSHKHELREIPVTRHV